jgi:hypothetical protein
LNGPASFSTLAEHEPVQSQHAFDARGGNAPMSGIDLAEAAKRIAGEVEIALISEELAPHHVAVSQRLRRPGSLRSSSTGAAGILQHYWYRG